MCSMGSRSDYGNYGGFSRESANDGKETQLSSHIAGYRDSVLPLQQASMSGPSKHSKQWQHTSLSRPLPHSPSNEEKAASSPLSRTSPSSLRDNTSSTGNF